jgi:hypothetical protein
VASQSPRLFHLPATLAALDSAVGAPGSTGSVTTQSAGSDAHPGPAGAGSAPGVGAWEPPKSLRRQVGVVMSMHARQAVGCSAPSREQRWLGQPPQQRQYSYRHDSREEHQHPTQHSRWVRFSWTHTQMVTVRCSSGHGLTVARGRLPLVLLSVSRR